MSTRTSLPTYVRARIRRWWRGDVSSQFVCRKRTEQGMLCQLHSGHGGPCWAARG